jgi:hypothetical protein
MKEADKDLLFIKRKQLHLKLQAADYVKTGITYHWLDYFKTIQGLGIFFEIDYLCYGSEEEIPPIQDAIRALNEPYLLPEMVIHNPGGIREQILQLYPSVSDFKYVMNLPLLDEYNTDTAAMLSKARQLLGCSNELVYFFSTDASPVTRLNWEDLLANANRIFDDGIISLVFIDISRQWIIFRSIENEWRAGFVKSA